MTDAEIVEQQTRPSVDRAWELMEMAYAERDVQVVGWADSSLMGWDSGGGEHSEGITFSAYKQVKRSHEDVVLVIAIRVPHPDHMSLEEVIGPCDLCGGTGFTWRDYWSQDAEPCPRNCEPSPDSGFVEPSA